MPIKLKVTFMEADPPKIRRSSTHPSLDVEPRDKTIIMEMAGGRKGLFRQDDQWFQDFIQKNMPWAVGKGFSFVDHGTRIEITFD